MTVIFDDRAVFAWNPPTDDPWAWQAPLNGSYYFNFTGTGTVTPNTDPGEKGVTVTNVTFDPYTYTTAGYINLPDGSPDLMEMVITNTTRNSTAPVNSGFTNLRIMRPGHENDGLYTLSPELVAMLAPFDHFRFMGITGTNTNPGYYGDIGHHYLNFSNRCLLTDALNPFSALRPGCWGLPWEVPIQVSQATNKGIWINAPVSATVANPPDPSTYVYQWAQLLQNGNEYTNNTGVPSTVPIYVEHSNEVWNFGFGQYIWNKLAAIDECNVTTHANGCLWNNDNSTDQEAWAQRRHIGKVYEIGQTFAAVFGNDALITRIRPIYADWTIFPDRYNETLTWFNKTYGAPSKYLYGMAATAYYGNQPFANSTIDDIYFGYMNSSDSQYASRTALAAIANYWGLKLVAYEAGPGWNVGDTAGVNTTIIAQRLYPMRKVVKYDIETSWIPAGGNEYNYFSLTGYYSRFGQWGSTEHFFNTTTPKYCGILDLTNEEGTPLPKGCQGY